MKKSVLLIMIFLSFTVFLWLTNGNTIMTGLQVLDLPPPPSPPGMYGDTYDQQVIYVGTAAQPEAEYPVYQPAAPSPRLDVVEEKIALVQDLESRLNGVESRQDRIEVYVRNLARPQAEVPSAELQRTSRLALINSVLLGFFFVLIVILVALFVVSQRVRKRHELTEQSEIIGEYIRDYERQGYDRAALKEHLRSSGYSEEVIEKAEKEMWK